ncbi:DNA-binding protein [Marivirga lumbricoides]|uniref:DNA-binding protein n=2 Tax=Marivirga lumbricoides TaxID=1046115 RepID=A0ABQ1N759_9BACT|nr:DNA-binding protein [Marivirga lumbricoides]
MEKLKEFDIQIYKLSNKLHEYEFFVDNDFFSLFEGEIVESGRFSIKIELDKRENLIELNINFEGYLNLVCDRSLKDFEKPISLRKKLLYKYGEEEAELEDDVFVITKTTQSINPAHFIYETIALEVPLKKIHPDEELEDEESNEYIYIDDSLDSEEEENEEVDPRWEALKNLKNKN